MPRFRIVVEGSGIELPGEVVNAPARKIRGFFVSRVVNAPRAEVAAERATAVIALEWSRGPMADFRSKPVLRVAEVRRVGFLDWLRPRNTGYVFHPGDAE